MAASPVLDRSDLADALTRDWPPAEVALVLGRMRSDGKLQPGPRALAPGIVIAVQRERMLAGMIAAVADLGYRSVRVLDVLERSGVSRRTFYETFESMDACYDVAFDATLERLRDRLAAESSHLERWGDRLRCGLEALLRFLDERPHAARMLILEAGHSGPKMVARREAAMEQAARWLDRGRPPAGGGPAMPGAGPPAPSIAARGIVGGVDSLLRSRLVSAPRPRLRDLLPDLVCFAAQPFLEPAEVAAQTELAREQAQSLTA